MGHYFVGHFGVPASSLTVGALSYAVLAEEKKLFVYFSHELLFLVKKRQDHVSLVEQLSLSSWSHYFGNIKDIAVRFLGKEQEIFNQEK